MKDKLKIIGITALLFIVVDFGIQFYQLKKEENLETSYYSYELRTRSDKPLSNFPGDLKLHLHPGLVYKMAPNQSNERFSINSMGFRGEEFGSKKGDVKRIILLGGSTAFGTGLDSDQETLAANLERILPSTEVLNLATIGYLSRQELTLLLDYIDVLKPDLVITLNGWNDLGIPWGFPLDEFHPAYGGFFQLQLSLKDYADLVDDNFFIRFWNNFVNTFFYGTKKILQGSSIEKARRAAQRSNSHVNEDLIAKEYVNNLMRMQKVSAGHGAKFRCYIQPDARVLLQEIDDNEVEVKIFNLFNRFREHVRGYLRENNLSCYDFNNHPKMFEENMFLDTIHLNAKGNKVLAESIAKDLRSVISSWP